MNNNLSIKNAQCTAKPTQAQIQSQDKLQQILKKAEKYTSLIFRKQISKNDPNSRQARNQKRGKHQVSDDEEEDHQRTMSQDKYKEGKDSKRKSMSKASSAIDEELNEDEDFQVSSLT
jgi:hypothetical protein